ncbi:MAG: Fic family protein [Thermaerobacter sp.]|nr:Fic family protein [Thermaerobacter sp.]
MSWTPPRTTGVRISGSPHVPPDPVEVPGLVDAWLQRWNTATGSHPIVRAAELHSAFVDGNGRMARLLTNLDLVRQGLRPPCCFLPSDSRITVRWQTLGSRVGTLWSVILRSRFIGHFSTIGNRIFPHSHRAHTLRVGTRNRRFREGPPRLDGSLPRQATTSAGAKRGMMCVGWWAGWERPPGRSV